MAHKTQLLLHNPQALRVEFHLDEARLILWWSPKAGESYDCRDRFFSSRDDHLDVFQEIVLPGCELRAFLRTDYDAYHSVLHFQDRELHIAVHDQLPVCLVWASAPQPVDFKTHRFDTVREAGVDAFVVDHPTPAYTFEFAALAGGGGRFRHCGVRGEWRSAHARAELAPGQVLAIGAGLDGAGIAGRIRRLGLDDPDRIRADIEARLAGVAATGEIQSSSHPQLAALRRTLVRGLHSMIDASGAYRASIKEIYYLIWVRDGGFSFPFQAAAGWPHKLEEFCRLLLANPTTARGQGIPPGRMFGQLIHRDFGKYEEDGAYYVVWSLFTHWTQTGDKRLLTAGNLALLQEAVDWVERYCFDAGPGLFGEYTADETAATGSRDDQWDYAIGKPLAWDGPYYNGHRITRYYDLYINTLMHSAWTMLAAMLPDPEQAAGYRAKADALWSRMRVFLDELVDGLPPYGDLLTESGAMLRAAPMGPVYGQSSYIWGLTMPNFLPCRELDAIRIRLLQRIAANPEMHFINGICSTILSVDPWIHPEQDMLAMLEAIAEQANRHGAYMVMPGAMPEKFNAPEGNLYHDIRPQGFAMGSWLAAWSSLGVRRLPYGLALRPTRAFEALDNYPWRGRLLQFRFGPAGRALRLAVNGRPVPHTLQVPEEALDAERNTIVLCDDGDAFLWLRSTVELRSVQAQGPSITYSVVAWGLSEIGFSAAPHSVIIRDTAGREVPFTAETGPVYTVRFSACGALNIRVALSHRGQA